MDATSAIMIGVGILVLLSTGYLWVMSLSIPKAFNSGTSLGVNSTLSISADLLMSLFMVYLPISFVWLGGFLLILTGKFIFMWPTLGSAVACILLLVVSKFF